MGLATHIHMLNRPSLIILFSICMISDIGCFGQLVSPLCITRHKMTDISVFTCVILDIHLIKVVQCVVMCSFNKSQTLKTNFLLQFSYI